MKRLGAEDVVGNIVDVRAHAGFSVKSFANCEYPYGQTIEGLAYKHAANGVDFGVVFPFVPELYFDLHTAARTGELRETGRPISASPYELENRMLFAEIFEYCPELAERFLPFVCIDPMRKTEAQRAAISALESKYPVNGMKLSPVLYQAPVSRLLGPGSVLLDHAATHAYPIIVHTTVHPDKSLPGELSQSIHLQHG